MFSRRVKLVCFLWRRRSRRNSGFGNWYVWQVDTWNFLVSGHHLICSRRNWECLALKPRISPKSKTVVSVVTQNKTIWYRVKKRILKTLPETNMHRTCSDYVRMNPRVYHSSGINRNSWTWVSCPSWPKLPSKCSKKPVYCEAEKKCYVNFSIVLIFWISVDFSNEMQLLL